MATLDLQRTYTYKEISTIVVDIQVSPCISQITAHLWEKSPPKLEEVIREVGKQGPPISNRFEKILGSDHISSIALLILTNPNPNEYTFSYNRQALQWESHPIPNQKQRHRKRKTIGEYYTQIHHIEYFKQLILTPEFNTSRGRLIKALRQWRTTWEEEATAPNIYHIVKDLAGIIQNTDLTIKLLKVIFVDPKDSKIATGLLQSTYF